MLTSIPHQIGFSAKKVSVKLYFYAAFVLILSFHGCSSKYTVKTSEYYDSSCVINQHTRLIKANKAQVFRTLTQEKTFREICPASTIVNYESLPPFRVGTIVKTKIEQLFTFEWHSRVEQIEVDSKIRLRFLDGFFADGTEKWEMEKEGPHTRVTHTIIFQPDNIFKNLAWKLKVKDRHDDLVETFFDNLETTLATPDVHVLFIEWAHSHEAGIHQNTQSIK